jgi:cytochrome d ubiquinol oxidase subunit I
VDAVTPAVTASAALTSLAAFVIVYGIIFPAGLLYLLRLVRAGPVPPGEREQPLRPPGRPPGRPMRPLSGADTLEPAE